MSLTVSPVAEGLATRVQTNKSPVFVRTASIDTLTDGKVNFNKENSCWSCEGWLEKRFKVNLQKVFPELQIQDDASSYHYNVFLHFDFDDWQPDITEDRRKTNARFKGKH